ncbi:MAG: cyclic nucleotide-binding domain-containing protein [Rhodospirillaceae bacterium]|nr:MAG: cyclic nucleotide-binding domain-containing protein [Rhodospirillaceae bacterium]
MNHLRNVELLQRAVDASQAALEVRSQETAPLLWAASQNNLGSALFMLGRNANDSEYLQQSVEAFRSALQVYELHGAVKMVVVAEKNLAKAVPLLESLRRRRVARPEWARNHAEDDGPEETPHLEN